jgi:hypothetical protein
LIRLKPPHGPPTRDPTGDTTKDVTRTYAYGKAGVGGPNALQVGEREKGLTVGSQPPPTGTDHTPVPPQLLSEQAKSRAGHVHAGWINKRVEPLVETVLLVGNPSTKGFATLSAQLPSVPSAWQTLTEPLSSCAVGMKWAGQVG